MKVVQTKLYSNKTTDSEKNRLFIFRAKNVHGDKYLYDLVNYKNNRDKVKIICVSHGEFLQKPSHHINGVGCKECSKLEKIKKLEKVWTDEQLSYLIKNFPIKSIRKISNDLKMSFQTVYKKIKSLELSKKQKTRFHPHIPNFTWRALITGAKNRNYSVNITIEDIWNKYKKQNGRCALSGWPVRFSDNKVESTASVDRINSRIGYTKENIQIVHKHLNKLKMDWDEEYFYKMCKSVVSNRLDLKKREIFWETDIINDTEYPILK